MLMQKLFYYIQAAAAKSHPAAAAANRHNNSWQLPQTAPGFWDFAPTLLVIYGRPRTIQALQARMQISLFRQIFLCTRADVMQRKCKFTSALLANNGNCFYFSIL
jgi:hypothetical protein